MKKIIKGTKINGTVNAIPSKSFAHRIAICNFLAGKQPTAGCKGFSSNDIAVTEQCLKSIKNGEKVLDCGESGSTIRFLLPLASALGGDYEFVGHGKLMDRPNEELFSVLNEHGIKTTKTNSIRISGKLSSGEYRIRGDISSQYVSGLLMALPILNGDSKIILTTPLVSAPYVEITLQVLNSFGVNIEKTDYGFFVKGNSVYKGEIEPEGDWSNSAFFLVLGAICGKVTVNGLNLASVQGDMVIKDIIKKAGAKVLETKNSITVEQASLNAFSFDAENCPDLVPIATVLASFAKGKTVIKNVQRLKIKESDRIATTIEMLNNFGIKAENVGNDLIVYGGTPQSGCVNSHNDHRIAMSATVLSAGASGESVIEDASAVNKSYPTFFEDYQKAGGIVYEL